MLPLPFLVVELFSLFVYESCHGSAIRQYHHNIKNIIFSAGITYATVWNQDSLSQTDIKKAELVIPVVKKDVQAKEDLISSLKPFATAFGINISVMISIAELIDLLDTVTSKGRINDSFCQRQATADDCLNFAHLQWKSVICDLGIFLEGLQKQAG